MRLLMIDRLASVALMVARRTGPDIKTADICRWLKTATPGKWRELAAMANVTPPPKEVRAAVVEHLERTA